MPLVTQPLYNTLLGAGGEPVLTETADLELWINCDQDNIGTTGSLIDTYTDLSGNGRTVTCLGVDRPTVVTDELDGRSVSRHSDDHGLLPASINYTGGAYTVYYVCKVTGLNGTGGQSFWSYDSGSAASQHFGGPLNSNVLATGQPYHARNNGGAIRARNDANFNGDWGLLIHRHDSILLDENNGGYASSGDVHSTGVKAVFTRSWNGAFYFVGDHAEKLVYSVDHSAGQEDNVVSYLRARFPSLN